LFFCLSLSSLVFGLLFECVECIETSRNIHLLVLDFYCLGMLRVVNITDVQHVCNIALSVCLSVCLSNMHQQYSTVQYSMYENLNSVIPSIVNSLKQYVISVSSCNTSISLFDRWCASYGHI
jgi:ABC-type uncharacterized transport system YnjBCD permease subunit